VQGSCPAGHFAGTYTGKYTSPVGLGSVTSVTDGHVDFTVDASGQVSGKFTGTTTPSSKADIAGTLDCATGKLTADLTNGSYTVKTGLVSTTYDYTGTLTGAFDGAKASFAGAWTVRESGRNASGSGTWTAP
jgi:hypothetical protein